MASLGKKIATAFAYGNGLGFVFYLMGEIAKTVLSLSTPLGLIGYFIGLSCSIGIALAKDEKEE
ncbi:MAG: hypothetical protein J7J51_05270 [Candidatus Omnitrophica bacterium]|nr:hypothetical protein [Candidatus Omnitrophota bacterium]